MVLADQWRDRHLNVFDRLEQIFLKCRERYVLSSVFLPLLDRLHVDFVLEGHQTKNARVVD